MFGSLLSNLLIFNVFFVLTFSSDKNKRSSNRLSDDLTKEDRRILRQSKSLHVLSVLSSVEIYSIFQCAEYNNKIQYSLSNRLE